MVDNGLNVLLAVKIFALQRMLGLSGRDVYACLSGNIEGGAEGLLKVLEDSSDTREFSGDVGFQWF